MTPVELKLAEAAVSRGEQILRDFDCTHPGTPLHWILGAAKRRAAEALVALIDVDPSEAAAIQRLQTEARRYGDLVNFMRNIISDAEDAHQLLSAEDREEILGHLDEAAMTAGYAEGE